MKQLFTLFLIGSLFACASSSTIDESLLIGKWKGVSWIVDNDPNARKPEQTQFEFKKDGTYTASYGSEVEKGTYRVQYGKLYTTEVNKAEKNVGIDQLTKDSLVFNMNRVGTIETLTLVSVK